MKRTILQRGGDCSDLIVYAHIDGTILKPVVPKVTTDTFVTLFGGAGTAAYRGYVAGLGGWRGFVADLERELGCKFNRTLLVTWSAGSQVAMEACAGGDAPDAVVMLDGLYGSKPAGSKMGDGRVLDSPGLDAVFGAALAAARRQKTAAGGERTFVIFHSRIPTPYASSKECAEWVVNHVVTATGEAMAVASDVDAAKLDGHFFVEALEQGNLRVVEFGGANAAEHIREAHLWDEALAIWAPWTSGVNVCDAPTTSSPTSAEDAAPPVPAATARVLRLMSPMMRGEDVRAWQGFLAAQGALVDGTRTSPSWDGIFGPKTEAATRTWQTAYVVPVTGQLDATTLLTARTAGFGAVTPLPSTPITTPAAVTPLPTIAAAIVRRALLDRGIGEDLGKNDGRAIREMGKRWGFQPGQNWCAAAASSWVLDGCADAGVAAPILGSLGAQSLMAQFKAAKRPDGSSRWISAAAARKDPSLVRPGLIPVWDRAVAGKPETSWYGHVGVTTGGITSGTFPTIEGNSGKDGTRVAEMSQLLSNGRLFGFGVPD